MKIKCLVGTVASGVRLDAGKEYDVSDKDGRLLCAIGKAEPVEDMEVLPAGLSTSTGPGVKRGTRRGKSQG